MRSFLLAIAALASCCGHHPSDPIILAVSQGDARRVSALREGGADVNWSCSGLTAPIMAAGHAYDDIVRLLLKRGPDAYAKKADGVHARWLAAGHATAVEHAPDLQLSENLQGRTARASHYTSVLGLLGQQ